MGRDHDGADGGAGAGSAHYLHRLDGAVRQKRKLSSIGGDHPGNWPFLFFSSLFHFYFYCSILFYFILIYIFFIWWTWGTVQLGRVVTANQEKKSLKKNKNGLVFPFEDKKNGV